MAAPSKKRDSVPAPAAFAVRAASPREQNLLARGYCARTCRAWVERLSAQEEACRKLAGSAVHRTWLLYLAASALSFESGHTEVHQVLFAKRGSPRRHWTRQYMYGPAG